MRRAGQSGRFVTKQGDLLVPTDGYRVKKLTLRYKGYIESWRRRDTPFDKKLKVFFEKPLPGFCVKRFPIARAVGRRGALMLNVKCFIKNTSHFAQ